MEDDLEYAYFLTRVDKLGNARIRNILFRIHNLYDLCNCTPADLRKVEGIDINLAKEIFFAKRKLKEFSAEWEQIKSNAYSKGIKIVCILSDKYPINLKNIFDAPVILYYKGDLSEMDRYSISIVGTRTPTEYGKFICEKFTGIFSELKIPVVSGFARGTDTVVHKTCVRNGNITYAILGSGVDIIYPYENKKLYHEITENGAVISEFPIGSKPEKVNFPRRNRIISGISLGSLIIESGMKGGSLLTAEFAIDQNKEVFAIPGYINSGQSEGTNDLIKRGQAKLVTNVEDVLNELENKLKPILKKESMVKESKAIMELSCNEKIIFQAIEYEPRHIDLINETTGLPVSDCLVNLLSLEFKGLIKQLPGKNFMRI